MRISHKVILISIGAILTLVSYAELKSIYPGETLELKQVKERWGSLPLDEKKFREGSVTVRGQMAFSIIQSKKFLGSSLDSVKEKLGSPDGHFWNDQIPTYILNEGWKNAEDVWQLVFLPGKGNTVKDVIVNKNCCDKK